VQEGGTWDVLAGAGYVELLHRFPCAHDVVMYKMKFFRMLGETHWQLYSGGPLGHTWMLEAEGKSEDMVNLSDAYPRAERLFLTSKELERQFPEVFMAMMEPA